MGRVKGLRGEVPEGSREPRGFSRKAVPASKRVAVVLDQPEIVLPAEGEHRFQVKGISQGVRHHDGLRFPGGEGLFQHFNARIAGGGVAVDENGDGSILDDGRHGGRKTRRAGDDFVPGSDAPRFGEFRARQRGKCEQVRGRAGINEDRVLDPQGGGELLLEGRSFRA